MSIHAVSTPSASAVAVARIKAILDLPEAQGTMQSAAHHIALKTALSVEQSRELLACFARSSGADLNPGSIYARYNRKSDQS